MFSDSKANADLNDIIEGLRTLSDKETSNERHIEALYFMKLAAQLAEIRLQYSREMNQVLKSLRDKFIPNG